MGSAVSGTSRHHHERRRAHRRRGLDEHGIVSVRVRPGRDVGLIDISAAGALVESTHQLSPGSPVELHVATQERRASVRGRVVRCSVAGLLATGVRYRGAIGFDQHLSWFVDVGEPGYSVPSTELRPLWPGRGDVSRFMP